MGHLTIQNLDDTTLDRLRIKAEVSHKSVEDTAAEILNEACRKVLSPEERYKTIMLIRSEVPPSTGRKYPTAEEMIREDRDSH